MNQLELLGYRANGRRPSPLDPNELLVDGFAGGGGASIGMELAHSRSVDIAVNHSPNAIAVHRANHPATRHYLQSVWDVHPVEACGRRPVGHKHLSPDCTFFSKACGGKPRSRKIRALAYSAVRWAKYVRPRVITLENVEEFEDWGPLLDSGHPNPDRKGTTFRRWVSKLRSYGYELDWRVLNAADFGAPTSRKRLFVVARCDREPIVWPEPTHGPGRLPYRTAAECIDWSIPTRSIFGRAKPLAEATHRRIAAGIMRYVVGATEPVSRIEGDARIVGFVTKHYGGVVGHQLTRPLGTITTIDHHALTTATVVPGSQHSAEVRAFLVKYYGTGVGQSLNEPLHTITTKDRFALVRIDGRDHCITDISTRMLEPNELFAAQGFPPSYVIDPVVDGRRLSKTAQKELVGNSVCPGVEAALVAVNFGRQIQAVA